MRPKFTTVQIRKIDLSSQARPAQFLGRSVLVAGSAHETGIFSSNPGLLFLDLILRTDLLFEVMVKRRCSGWWEVGFCPFACSGAWNHLMPGNATALVAVSRNWLHFYVK